MKPKSRHESGFALLLVFAMAAAIAIMLYMALPREAFERQRDKEQLLIDRGEQYKRAIQVYFRKFKQYPTSLDALAETNGMHFLRHKYIDPMTGKNEWRLIHIGPGGVFTDSKTMAPPSPDKEKDKAKSENTFITEGPSIGSTGANQGATPTASYRRERGGPMVSPTGQPYPGTDAMPTTGVPTTGMPGQPQPGQPWPQYAAPQGQPGAPTGQPGQPTGLPYGMPQGYMVQPGTGPQGVPPGVPVPYVPGQYPPQMIPGSAGQAQPVPYTYPPLPANSQQGGVSNPYYPTQPGVGGAPGAAPAPFGQPGTSGAPTPFNNTGNNPATQMIQQLLMTPRPGGPPGGQTDQGMGLGAITGGIAGVASKLEEDSIKVYKDQTEYDKWEFLYDPRKEIAERLGIASPSAPGSSPKTTQGPGTSPMSPTTPTSPFSPSPTSPTSPIH